jgi:hypothetical protein
LQTQSLPPKSTACICGILENKMTGGETASFAPTLTFPSYETFGIIQDLFIFVKVGARFPRPQTMNQMMKNGTFLKKIRFNCMRRHNENQGVYIHTNNRLVGFPYVWC